jgi:hypothetical protein
LQEKGKKGAYTATLLKALERIVQQEDGEQTVLIWESKRLPVDHALRVWFQEHEGRGITKQYEFNVPFYKQLAEEGIAYIEAQKGTIDRDALRFIETSLQEIDKEQRNQERVRSSDVPAVDVRRWWLWNLLDTALLVAPEGRITAVVVKQCGGEIQTSATPFEIVNACDQKQWQRARSLLKSWNTADEEGAYFLLVSLLRQRYRTHMPHTSAQYALKLLAEIELLSKNGVGHISWLLDLFCWRLQEGKHELSLVPARTLWLATQ